MNKIAQIRTRLKAIKLDRNAILITAAYLLVGGLWILFSDRFAEALSSDTHTLTTISTYKGWFYVLVTGLFLYWLIHFNNSRLQKENEGLQAAEKKYQLLVEQIPITTYEAEVGGHSLYISPQVEGLIGFSSSEWLADRDLWLKQIHPDDKQRVLDENARAVSGNHRYSLEYRIQRKDGRMIWIRDEGFVVKPFSDTFPIVHGIWQDITERKQDEKKILHLNRLYATLSQINQTIVHAQDRDSLFSEVCRVTIEHGKFCMAWIGLIDKANEYVRPIVFAGEEQGYLTNISIVVQDPKLGGGPTGTAMREGRCIICQDIANDPRMTPWREPALQRGYRSLAAVPIWQKKLPIGALTVYASEPQGFSDDDQNLLDEIGQKISYAVDSINAETEHRQAEQAVRESEERFRTFIEQSADGAVLIDEQEKIIEWNLAQKEITGISKVQALGSSFAEIQYRLLPPSRRAQTSAKHIKDTMKDAFHSGKSTYFDKPVAVEIQTPSGEQKFLRQNAFSIKTEHGFRIGVVIHDVTESIQAEKNIRQRLTELELVYKSGLELSRILEPEQIAQKIIEQMEKNLDWHHSAIRLYDPESQTLKVIGFNVPGLENEIDRGGLTGHFNNLVQKLGDGLSGWAVQRGQTLRIGDLKRDPHYAETFPGLNSGLYVLIKTENRIIGVISVENELPNAFSESDERLVGTLANQAAIALENSRLHNETQRQLNRLKALHSLDLAITNSLDLNVTLDVLLNQVMQQLHVDAAVIFLKEANINDLKYAMSKGFHTRLLERVNPGALLNESLAGRAIMERRAIEAQAPLEGRLKEIWLAEGFHSNYAIPLLSKGEPKGVLEVFSRTEDKAIAKDQMSFMETLAGQAAIAIENHHLFDGLQRSNMELAIAYDATIEGWSRAMDLRDKETEGHTQRVTAMTMKLAADFDFSGEMLMHIRHGALLHDIGKLGIPDHILLKPDTLTVEEWVWMKKHPTFAFEMLAPIQYLNRAINIPYCHHEKWDGTGYPRGLSGEQIPLEARIFAVVDVWDAITSDRPYRKAWTQEKAMEYIRSLAGTHFDPAVVERFVELKKKEIQQEK